MKGVPGYMIKGVSTTFETSTFRRCRDWTTLKIDVQCRCFQCRFFECRCFECCPRTPFSYSPELLSSSLELRKFLFFADDGIFGFHSFPKKRLDLNEKTHTHENTHTHTHTWKHTHTHTYTHTHTHTHSRQECCWFSLWCWPLAIYTDAS